MNKQSIKITIFSAICILANILQAGIDYGSMVKGDEPELYVDRYGKGEPVVVSNGYLFVELNYVSSPYHIQRVGQAVVVNGRVVNCLFRGDPPFGKGVETNGVNEEVLKSRGDANVNILAGRLGYAPVVILYKEGYQKRGSEHDKPIKEERMSLRVPLLNRVYGDRFYRVFENILTNQSIETVSEKNKIKMAFCLPDDDTTCLFIIKAKTNAALTERVHNEIAAENNSLKLTPLPYARVTSELEVVSATGYGWKLTVLFDNGLEFYIGRDMEIRDILFTTNAITVEAYRDDLRFPLPTTKRIRVAPKLQTTLKSCKTGQTCTATITDSLDNAISMDDLKYQVVDIRPSTQTVLLKNCKTGERIFVAPQKPGTGAESK